MESIFFSIVSFIFVIGILVFIHEAGHFSVAKLFKVHVEAFALGFGPRLWGFKKGETDYRINALPLGGYVKMLGENPDEMEEAKGLEGALGSKPGWQRFLIFIAGPAANILLALLIPATTFMINYEIPAYRVEPTRVGFVAASASAYRSGIRKGDLIVAFDGVKDPIWDEVEDLTLLKPGQQVPVVVEREGQRLALSLEIGTQMIEGERIGVSGLLPDLPGDGVGIRTVEEGKPAAQAGLQAGDKIIQIEDLPIRNIIELQTVVRPAVDQPLRFTVLRHGETIAMTITPFKDPDLGYGRVGFASTTFAPPMISSRLGPIDATRMAINESVRTLWMMKEAVVSVVEGNRSVGETFAGPVQIAAISGEAARRGFGDILRVMALLSLSLGIFNLFPIPILDGGQVMMLFLEKGFKWFGGELSVALREKIQTVGFAVIVLLMGYIIYADIAKLIQ